MEGTSSLQFQQPETALVIVQPDIPELPVYFTSRGFEPGMLQTESCASASPLDYICPRQIDQILFSSACRWYDNA